MNSTKEDVVIKRNEKTTKKQTGTKVIGMCVVLLILVMVLAAVISNISGISIADIGPTGANGTLIYNSLPDSIRDVDSYSSGTVMLTDTSIEYLDNSGKKLATNSHLYSQPVMKVRGSTVLLYDKGGTQFRLEKNSSVYNTYTVSGTLTTAALGAKGNYAYVLNEDSAYQSHLFVYSYQGKKQFEWGSASDYCITVALSDNGKSVAVSMLGVKNGEYLSKVSLFNFKENDARYTVELPDCTVYQLVFVNNKTLAALTDNGIFVINKNGESEKIAEYSSSELNYSDSTESGLKAFALNRYSNSKDSQVKIYNKKFAELYTLDFDSEIYSVCTSKSYVAVMLGDHIKVYNNKGEEIGSIIIGEKCIASVFSGRTLFVRTVSGIYSFDADADTDLTVSEKENTSAVNKDFTEEASEAETAESDTKKHAEETSSDVQENSFG